MWMGVSDDRGHSQKDQLARPQPQATSMALPMSADGVAAAGPAAWAHDQQRFAAPGLCATAAPPMVYMPPMQPDIELIPASWGQAGIKAAMAGSCAMPYSVAGPSDQQLQQGKDMWQAPEHTTAQQPEHIHPGPMGLGPPDQVYAAQHEHYQQQSACQRIQADQPIYAASPSCRPPKQLLQQQRRRSLQGASVTRKKKAALPAEASYGCEGDLQASAEASMLDDATMPGSWRSSDAGANSAPHSRRPSWLGGAAAHCCEAVTEHVSAAPAAQVPALAAAVQPMLLADE
jgi:hypothetical protein